MEYSLKQIKASQKIAMEHNDNTPLVVPADCTQPETYNEAIARILRHSGVIDDGAYEKLRGFNYDGDFEDGAEDFDDFDDYEDDDGFEQSSFAEYEKFDMPTPDATQRSEAPASVGSPEPVEVEPDSTDAESE